LCCVIITSGVFVPDHYPFIPFVVLPARPLNLRFPLPHKLFLLLRDRPVFGRLLRMFALPLFAVGT
jgi:hypothetical protein